MNRELANTIQRCACLTSRGVIGDQEVKEALQDASPTVASEGSIRYQDVLNRGERQALEMLLRRHRGNVSRAAKDAKMTRQGLHKAMIRLGISADRFRT